MNTVPYFLALMLAFFRLALVAEALPDPVCHIHPASGIASGTPESGVAARAFTTRLHLTRRHCAPRNTGLPISPRVYIGCMMVKENTGTPTCPKAAGEVTTSHGRTQACLLCKQQQENLTSSKVRREQAYHGACYQGCQSIECSALA